MIVGSVGYLTNDALVRSATEEGLDVYQALCLRGIAMTVLFAAITRRRGDRFTRLQFTRPLVVRVAAELVATALFFGALLAGFAGDLLVVQPATDGFSLWSLAVLASAGLMTIREFATRRVSNEIPATSVALITAAGLTILTGAISFVTGWNSVTPLAALLVVLACLCLIVGYIFTIQTVRVGDLSVSAPFRYTALLGAVILGYLFFDEIPDALTIAGCSAIVASGIYAIHLERRDVVKARPDPTA